MRYIPSIGTVNPDLINLCRILAEIFDVAEDMAATVLADEIAEICAQAHVCHGGFVITPFLDGETLEQDEAFSIDEICAQLVEVSCELRQWEVALCNRWDYVSFTISHFLPRSRFAISPLKCQSKASWKQGTDPPQHSAQQPAPH